MAAGHTLKPARNVSIHSWEPGAAEIVLGKTENANMEVYFFDEIRYQLDLAFLRRMGGKGRL